MFTHDAGLGSDCENITAYLRHDISAWFIIKTNIISTQRTDNNNVQLLA